MNPLFSGFYPRYDQSLNNDAGRDDPSLSDIRNSHELRDLEGRIDKLSMICCAMWTVLQAHADVSDEELARLVQELDLSDGELDGKARIEQVAPCTTCRRPVSTRHLRCIYCGRPRQAGNPFDDVL